MTLSEHQHLPIVSNDDVQQQLSSLKRNYEEGGKLNSSEISQPPETKSDDTNDSFALPLQKKTKITPEEQSSHEGVLNRPAELPQEVSSKNEDSVVEEERPKIASDEQTVGGDSNFPIRLPQEVSSNIMDSPLKEDKPKLASEGQNEERVSNLPVEFPQETSSNIKESALKEDKAKLAPEGHNSEEVVSLPVELPQDVSSNDKHINEKEGGSDLHMDHQSDNENSTKQSKNGGRKAVQKLCLETGEVLGTFQSVTDAAKSVDVTVAAVRHALTGWKGRKSGRKSSGGFGWQYAPHGVLPDSPISVSHSTERSADTQESSKPCVRRRMQNPELNVEQVCVETGKVLQTFKSLREASKITGANRKYIRKAFGKVYLGFFWRAAGSIDLPPHLGKEMNDSEVLLSATTSHNPHASMPLPINQITTDASQSRKPASAGSKLKTTSSSSSMKSPPRTQTPIATFFKLVQTPTNSRHREAPELSTNLSKAASQKLVDQESITGESISLRRADSAKDAEVLPRAKSHNLPLSTPLSTDHTTIDASHSRMPASTGFKRNTMPVSSKSPAKPRTPIDTAKTVKTPANKTFAVDGRDTTQVAPEKSADCYQVGDVVFCNSLKGGNKTKGLWQKGRVAIVRQTGRCDVVFEDGKVS